MKTNKDTKVYTGSPNDCYFLFLPLQFYYDDEELQEIITQLSFYSSISQVSQASQEYSLFFFLKN